MDFTRYEEIGEVLAIRLAQTVCLEHNDHQLDAVAQRATNALRTEQKMWRQECAINPSK